MRCLLFTSATACLLGLTCLPSAVPLDESMLQEPEGKSVVIGGIADTRPYFGKFHDQDGQEEGDFLLATCGCGDWRVLLRRADGAQAQLPIRFYSEGPYVAAGPVRFYGRENENAVLGTVQQDSGDAEGRVDALAARHQFSGVRGSAHAQSIQACVVCHIGDNPIWPQPPGHVPYVAGQTDCFTCHTVTIQ